MASNTDLPLEYQLRIQHFKNVINSATDMESLKELSCQIIEKSVVTDFLVNRMMKADVAMMRSTMGTGDNFESI